MRLKVKMHENVAVLILSGKLGETEIASALHKKVKSFIREGVKKFVFDMEEIDGISSSGLGTLMACQTSAINAEGQIKLADVHQTVYQYFRITGLDTYFNIYDSEQDALDDF